MVKPCREVGTDIYLFRYRQTHLYSICTHNNLLEELSLMINRAFVPDLVHGVYVSVAISQSRALDVFINVFMIETT